MSGAIRGLRRKDCPQCNKVFSTLSNLKRHVKKCNVDKLQELLYYKQSVNFKFSCVECGKNFNDERNLRNHKKVHNAPETERKTGAKKCALCSFQTAYKKSMLDHFRQVHEININFVELSFSSLEEFSSWKLETENETKSKFVKKDAERYKAHFTNTFVCHRSGLYKPEGKGLRQLKIKGSNKINAFCPASIKLIHDYKHESYKIIYIETHIGHEIDVGQDVEDHEDNKLFIHCEGGNISERDTTVEKQYGISTISVRPPLENIKMDVVGDLPISEAMEPLKMDDNLPRTVTPSATTSVCQPLENTNMNVVGKSTISESMDPLKMPGDTLSHKVTPSDTILPFEKVFVKNPFFINFKDNTGAFLNEIRSQSPSCTPQIINPDLNKSRSLNIHSGNVVKDGHSKDNGTYSNINHDHDYIRTNDDKLHNDNCTKANSPILHNALCTKTNGPELHNDKGNMFLTVNLTEYSKVIDIKRICGIVLVLNDEPTQNSENNTCTNVSHGNDSESFVKNESISESDSINVVTDGDESVSISTKKSLSKHCRINEKGEKEFQCPDCDKIYYSPRLLRKHFKKEHDTSYKYKCPKCPEVYKTENVLKNHIKREHYVKCQFCENKFQTAREYKIHLKEAHKEVPYNMCKPYYCEICDKEFTNKDEFLKHLRLHEGVICGICAERFNSREEYTAHEKKHPNRFFCVVCNKGFKEKCSLRAHEDVHNDPIFICNICQQGFKSKGSLRYHIVVHHNNQRRFMCDKCPTRFCNPGRLRWHQRAVHDKVRPFPCLECDKKFTCNSNLRLHHRIMHLKLKPYQCEFCGRQFAKKDALTNHRYIHTGTPRRKRERKVKPVQRKKKEQNKDKEIKNTPPVDCEICGKTIKSIIYMKAHLNTHLRIRKYKCNFCGLMFLHQTSKIRHEKAHEADPENKFVCPNCWKRMKTQEELDKHVERHNNRLRRHQCEICGEAFCRRMLLDNHMLLEHTKVEEIVKKEQELEDALQAINKL